jgi:F0F1-type ATP synthase delta subunit
MENAYAQALWQIIKKGTPQADAVRALHTYLLKSGRAALLPRIARSFERLAAGMHNRNAFTLTVADKTHEHSALKDISADLSMLNFDEKNVSIQIDPSLVGGWRMEGKELLIDASYKKHLLAMYTATTQA